MIDLAILILRVVVGIVMIAHSLPKLFWKRKVFDKKWRQEYGFPVGSVLLTGIAQAAGGLAIIAGVFTQLAAFILVLNMLVALRLQKDGTEARSWSQGIEPLKQAHIFRFHKGKRNTLDGASAPPRHSVVRQWLQQRRTAIH